MRALAEQGVEIPYVDLLKKLYNHQSATVLSGAESRRFQIERGVKQGDPISSFLFLVVLESIFRTLKQRWSRLNANRKGQYYGMVIDNPEDPLMDLRFADDVILVAACKRDMAKMIVDLQSEAQRYGLKIHMGKTVVLTNKADKRPASVDCCGCSIRVAKAEEAEKYLGRKLSINQCHETEVDNRISSGWGAFFKSKGALCNRNVLLKDRLRLFEAVVAPCVLYACGTWAVSADSTRKLRSAQRRMLRWMVGTPKQPQEDWVDFLKRSTQVSEELARKHGVCDWVTTQRSRKWTLAGAMARQKDGRWSCRLLDWRPWFRALPRRHVGHPRLRWSDSIVKAAGGSWIEAAQDAGLWAAMTDGFASRCA